MQPDLSKYYRDLKTGVTYYLEGKTKIGGIWKKVGSGVFATLDPQHFTVSASYDSFGASGNVNLSVTVSAKNFGTANYNDLGDQPCTFWENGGGDILTMRFGRNTFTLSWWQTGVLIGGKFDYVSDVWIGA